MAFDPAAKLDQLIWQRKLAELNWPQRWLLIALRYLYAMLRDVFAGQLTMRAMSLVYTTLLSVVPLIAFSFSVLKGFGVDEVLEQRMYLFFEPLGERGREITDQVMRLVDNVNSGVLGGVSFAFFVYTAISMVQKVEESFNYVWYVSKPRSFTRRFTEYMFLLLVGPLVIVIALGMITSLQNEGVVQYLLANDIVGPLFVATGELIPYALVMAMFAFVYAFMPNTRVKFKAAIVGGIAGGFMWASVGVLFATFVVSSAGTRQAVYASFAIAIVSLIWIYVNWLVLLLGSQIAFYVQNPEYLRFGRREPNLANSFRERIALDIMFRVGRAFRTADTRLTTESLSRELRVPSLTLAPVLDALESGGLITANEQEHLLPAREMSKIPLDDILEVVRSGAGNSHDAYISGNVSAIARDIDAAISKSVGVRTLADILDDAE